MEFKFSYSFTAKAEQDLDEIMHYIAVELSNPAAAKRLFDKIFDCIDTLRQFPDSGSLVENEFLTEKSVRRAIVDNYIIYYIADETQNKINIIRIAYGKRNTDGIFRST